MTLNKTNVISGTDCKHLLSTVSQEIKKVSYQLSTLVTDGEQHIQLFGGSTQQIELLEGLPTYCKILCRRHTAPAKVSIEYESAENIKSLKLKVFVSYNEAGPNKKNYHFKYSEKKSFSLYPLVNLERKFKNEYIYLAIESLQSCLISIKIDFSEDKPMTKNKLLAKNNPETHEGEEFASPGSDYMYFDNFGYTNIDNDRPQTDKIDKYVQQMGIWKSLVEKERKERRYDERRTKALSKKRELVVEDIKRHLFYLNRWEYRNK